MNSHRRVLFKLKLGDPDIQKALEEKIISACEAEFCETVSCTFDAGGFSLIAVAADILVVYSVDAKYSEAFKAREFIATKMVIFPFDGVQISDHLLGIAELAKVTLIPISRQAEKGLTFTADIVSALRKVLSESSPVAV